jgi:hypothetical protein
MAAETTALSSEATRSATSSVPSLQSFAGLWRIALRATFLGVASVYVGWNLFWLAQLHVPPSLFQALTRLPCPTTGCTRSILALLRGELGESLRYNALAVPICLLLAATTSQLLGQALVRKRLALSSWMIWAWSILLPLAWLLKLAGNPGYW